MKIYLPLLDNGNGSVMASFMLCHQAAFAGRDIQMDRASDSHADRGMNKVANAFLASDCEVWINLDADIHFTRKDVENLLSHDVPLVYGIYPKKQEDTPPCIGTFDALPMPDARGLATVRRCGRGFMLVRRALLEAMKEENGGPALRYHNHGKVEWNFFESGVVSGDYSCYGKSLGEDGLPMREWISEDWMFCERARALGVSTLVDVRIALGHEGSKVYRFSKEQVIRTDWQSVPGWFSEEDSAIYKLFARELPSGANIAEVGCFIGRSMCALTNFLFEQGKGATLHAVDTFQGTNGEAVQSQAVANLGGSLRRAFETNTAAFGCRPTIHEMDSLAAAASFPDESLDAIFIDGDHARGAVTADISAWLPKVKRGGIIAGHDADYPAVREAAESQLAGVGILGRCWYARK